MRLIQVNDNEWINLDAVMTVRIAMGSLRLRFSDSTFQDFSGEQADALAEIITKNSTNLNDLVELRRKQKAAREQSDEELFEAAVRDVGYEGVYGK